MAFTPEPTRTPTEIRDIYVTLKDMVGGTLEHPDPYQEADFAVLVELSDGTNVRRSGDLVPHITPAQRQGLMDFMTALRAQAETQILP
jgi:hypothetical protein